MDSTNELTAATVPEFKDRRTGLILFGILEILIGALCVLFVPLMLLGQSLAANATGGAAQYRMVLPAIAVYGLMAVVFLALGIGSIRARRWARALSLILGWSWLVSGALGFVVYAFILPKILQTAPAGGQRMPESARLVVLVVALVVMGVILVVLPGALVLFYQSKHVKATCEARDPVVRWTDACPLPLLALSLWFLLGGLFLLLMPVAYHSVVPCFGILLSGLPGALVYLGIAALWLYSAWLIYRLNSAGWWIALVGIVLFGVSNILTFTRVDVIEMYKLMGYPQAQIDQLEQFGIFRHGGMAWFAMLGFVPLFVYLLCVKKFFGRAKA